MSARGRGSDDSLGLLEQMQWAHRRRRKARSTQLGLPSTAWGGFKRLEALGWAAGLLTFGH
eukprot:8106765-Alexandrium_andersonii.AAC.1